MSEYKEISYLDYSADIKLHTRGLLHVVSDSFEFWLKDGHFHNINGPAIIYIDEPCTCSWYVNGESLISNEEFQEATGMSSEDMLAMVLKYGNIE